MRALIFALLAIGVVSSGGHEKESRRLVEWGTFFQGVAPSANVKYECDNNGQPICCGLMSDSVLEPEISKGEVGLSKDTCKITKVYVPSAYESYHFELAANLTAITDMRARRDKFIEYIRSDIDAANIWLERVRVHMQSEVVPVGVKEDMEYLSRFQVTKTCTGAAAHMSSTWVEWIEPLTIHARHPFSLRACEHTYTPDDLARQKFQVHNMQLTNVDYVLIHSGASIHEATSMSKHEHSKLEPHRNHQAVHRDAHIQTHNYFFDAGTSTFDSSPKWFLCAYLQRKIAFDQDFGFEYTLLEPQAFWRAVPPHIRPLYHFFNAPVTAGMEDKDLSPLKMIWEIATPEDFVSFKLDIDTPEIEIPIAMELLRNPEIARLVDEFFFELHFHCEVLMYCGWGDKMPQEYAGLKLDRESAMIFFKELREAGVRSHFWP